MKKADKQREIASKLNTATTGSPYGLDSIDGFGSSMQMLFECMNHGTDYPPLVAYAQAQMAHIKQMQAIAEEFPEAAALLRISAHTATKAGIELAKAALAGNAAVNDSRGRNNEAAKNEALELARALWAADSLKEYKLRFVADVIQGEMKSRCPFKDRRLRALIKPIAPPYALKGGRPKKQSPVTSN